MSDNCCALRKKNYDILVISNNGLTYRLCKSDLYAERKAEYYERLRQEEQMRKAQEEQRRMIEEERRKEEEECLRQQEEKLKNMRERQQKEEAERKRLLESTDLSTWSCLNCVSNLSWANRGGMANCGCYQSLGVPKNTPPEMAQTCKRYRPKL